MKHNVRLKASTQGQWMKYKGELKGARGGSEWKHKGGMKGARGDNGCNTREALHTFKLK